MRSPVQCMGPRLGTLPVFFRSSLSFFFLCFIIFFFFRPAPEVRGATPTRPTRWVAPIGQAGFSLMRESRGIRFVQLIKVTDCIGLSYSKEKRNVVRAAATTQVT